MFWWVSFHSGVYWTPNAFLTSVRWIWNRFAIAWNFVQNAPNWYNWCQSLCHDVLLEIFATNAPGPHHWNLNSCFGAFLSIWVHLEPFHYCTIQRAKRAKMVQLMQKFVPWCLLRIFATNAPDPHHWTLNSCFGAFLSVRVLLDHFSTARNLVQKRQTGAINAKVHATMSR